jgi:SOS-response transcriptional repressor LexA
MHMSDDNKFQTASKAYVRFVMDELRLTPSGLAKSAGIASSTLTRALNDPGHKFTLSTSTLGKIAKASGISPQPFFDTSDFVDMSMIPFVSKTLYDESWGENANPTSEEFEDTAEYSTLVVGQAAAGVWKTPEIARLEDLGALALAITGYARSDVFALIMTDEHAEPFAHRGDYVICVRRRAMEWSLGHGDLVIVERTRDKGSLIELTARRLIEVKGGSPYLRFDNQGRGFEEELLLKKDMTDSPDCKLLGVARYVIRSVHDKALDDEAYRRGFRRSKVK